MNKLKALIVSLILTLTGLAVMPASVAAAGSASLSLSPNGGSRTVGSTFSVSVVENSGATAVNGVQADLSVSPSLRLVGKSCGGSFEIAAPAGGNSLVCATVTPKTGAKAVGTLSFKVVAAGSGAVSFVPSSQITASDGQGFNVWNGSSNPASYSLAAAVAAPAAPTPEPQPAPAPTKAAEVKKTPVAKAVAPASKKNNVRKIWSGILLLLVVIAAILTFSEKARKQVVKWGNQISKNLSAGQKAALASVGAITTTKKVVKKSPAKKSKK